MSIPNPSHSWYALQVKTNFERVAANILEGKAFEIYLPTYRKTRRWSDRIKEIECPLFPGYVFCRFDVNKRLPILTTSGVRSVVGIGKTPAAIAEDEIRTVRRMAESGVGAMPWPFLKIGQRVVVRRGPLEGVEGVLVSVRNRFRIVVSVDLLQRSIAAEIDADSVCATQSLFARPARVLPSII
jgi:transcription antitermination factor NusG